MSREIDTSKPLSSEDRQYLMERGSEQQVAYLDQLHGVELSDEERQDLNEPRNEGPSMPPLVTTTIVDKQREDEESRRAKQLAEEAGLDYTSAPEESDEEYEEDQYDRMNARELKDELRSRDLPTSGRVEELRDRLRDDDQGPGGES